MRVAPRSLTCTVRVSSTMSAGVAALLSTGQVQVMSPRVRKAHRAGLHLLAVFGRGQRRDGHQQAPALNHFALMGVVQRGQAHVFAGDVLPHIQLRPVADRKTRKCSPGAMRVLNSVHSSGRWSLGCHWPKLSRWLKMRSLARAFLVAPRPADERIKAKFVNRLQQRDGLVRRCAARPAGQAHRCRGPCCLRRCAQSARPPAPAARWSRIGDHFGEVVAGVDHQQRKRQAAHAKGFFGAAAA